MSEGIVGEEGGFWRVIFEENGFGSVRTCWSKWSLCEDIRRRVQRGSLVLWTAGWMRKGGLEDGV